MTCTNSGQSGLITMLYMGLSRLNFHPTPGFKNAFSLPETLHLPYFITFPTSSLRGSLFFKHSPGGPLCSVPWGPHPVTFTILYHIHHHSSLASVSLARWEVSRAPVCFILTSPGACTGLAQSSGS